MLQGERPILGKPWFERSRGSITIKKRRAEGKLAKFAEDAFCVDLPPPPPIHVQPSLHRKIDPSSFEIYSADVDYQSLFRANFTPRDIVWGDVDESCRLCLFTYDAIRAVCEGWNDLWSIVKECINLACKYSQQQI